MMMSRWLVACFVSMAVHVSASSAGPVGAGVSGKATSPQRVVSLGGTVTEIIYELNKQDVLVGNDLSSIYPPAATVLPRVGYYRNLPLEGLLSLRPDLILASEKAGPPHVLKRIRELGVFVMTVSDEGNLESLYERIRQVAKALNVPEEGSRMERRIRNDIETVLKQGQHNRESAHPVRTVMLMQRSSQLNAASSGTAASAQLDLAGLHNVLAQQHGYKTLSAESLATLQPELIITTRSSVEAMGGIQTFSQSPGINLTPAARKGHILVMDDLLILGIGPRTAHTLQDLINARNRVMHSR